MRNTEAFLRTQNRWSRWQRGIALFLVFSLLAALVVMYVARFQTGLAQSLPTIVAVCGLVFLTLVLGVLLYQPPWYAVFVPMTVTAMILTDRLQSAVRAVDVVQPDAGDER